ASRPVADPRRGVLRQPRHRRDRQRPGGGHRRQLRAPSADPDRFRQNVRAVHPDRCRPADRRPAPRWEHLMSPWLPILMAVPVVGAIVVALLPKGSDKLAKQVTLLFSLVTLVLTGVMAAGFDPDGDRFQFTAAYN